MSELKPCPFCGNARCYTWPYWRVHCRDCGATGPKCNTEKEAIEAWNRREE